VFAQLFLSIAVTVTAVYGDDKIEIYSNILHMIYNHFYRIRVAYVII